MEKLNFSRKKQSNKEADKETEELKKAKEAHSSKKKKAAAIAAASVLALGLAAGAAVNSVNPEKALSERDLIPPYVVEETVDLPPITDELILDDEKKEKVKKQSAFSFYSAFVYIVGGVVSLFSGLAGLFGVPVIGRILVWIVFAAVVYLAIIIAVKKAFPDIPLRELFSKKNAVLIGLLIVLLIAAAEVAMYYGARFVLYIKLAVLIAGALIVFFGVRRIHLPFIS